MPAGLAAGMSGELALDLVSGALVATGAWFFFAGAVGILRFPDIYTRLHALAKADTLGLGFVALGLGVRAGAWSVRVELLVVWLLVLPATATVAHLLARTSLAERVASAGREGTEAPQE